MVVTTPARCAVLLYYGNRLICRFESAHAVVQGVSLFELFNAYDAHTKWAEEGPVRFQFENSGIDVDKVTLLRWIIQRLGEAAGRREPRDMGRYYRRTELSYLVPFNKPRTRKTSGSYRWHRHPKTLNEKRMNDLVMVEDGEPSPRAVRSSRYLPSAWDDFNRHVERNWKSFRRTRWV